MYGSAGRKDNYMLKLKYMFENFELAKLALENFEHDKDGLDEYLKWFRISSNAVYPFSAGGKRRFLRLSPAEEKREGNLRAELAFLEYLNEQGYPAAGPVASKTGETLLTLDTGWGRYYASVFVGVPGKPIEQSDYNRQLMLSYGRALGRLHRLSVRYRPERRKWSYSEVLEWIRTELVRCHAPGVMLGQVDSVREQLSSLERSDDNYGLVHYDFEPDNVFCDEQSGQCYVIDFEDGMYHFFLVDIEQVFDSLSDELDADAAQAAKEAFIEGYRSEKSLEEGFERKLPLMRRFCDLYSYARLIRCVEETLPDEPEWMSTLRSRLNERIMHLEEKSAR